MQEIRHKPKANMGAAPSSATQRLNIRMQAACLRHDTEKLRACLADPSFVRFDQRPQRGLRLVTSILETADRLETSDRSLEILEILLAHGAVLPKDAVARVAGMEHWEHKEQLLDLVVSRGAHPKALHWSGRNALAMAAHADDSDAQFQAIWRRLLAMGADPNHKRGKKESPMEYAQAAGRGETAQRLVDEHQARIEQARLEQETETSGHKAASRIGPRRL
jgi:hypothetical protein